LPRRSKGSEVALARTFHPPTYTPRRRRPQAGPLKVYWDGERAKGYAPMKKQGAIIMGIGGDNSDGAVGTFYEGAMARGFSPKATDDALQANIVAAGYGQ
jgi:non-reducing end alpha-L-arabinofuranosidase